MDINAHHSSWEEHISSDARGSALLDWMESHSTIVPSDGSPTRAETGDHSPGISTQDVSLVDTVMAYRFTWESIPEIGSDYLPLVLFLDKDIMVDCDLTRRRPKYSKADWSLIHKCFDNGIHAVSSFGFMQRRMEVISNLIEMTVSEAVPIKADRIREIVWMNAQQKQLNQKRNKFRQDLRSKRTQWLEMNRDITRLTGKSERATWHRHLDKISCS